MTTTFTIRDLVHETVNGLVDQYARRKPASGQLGLFANPSEKQRPLFSKKIDDENGRWLTIRGAHVFVSDDDGRILKGPKHFVGRTTEQIEEQGGRDSEEKKPNPKPLNEMGRISGGKAESKQLGLFGKTNPGLFDEKPAKPSTPPAEKGKPVDISEIIADAGNEFSNIKSENVAWWEREIKEKEIENIDPPKIGVTADNKWTVINGRHRIQAAKNLGHREMNVVFEGEGKKVVAPAENEEPFTLQQPKPDRKQTDFGSSDATKQGALFDNGKKGELKGQELLFNSDAGDLQNPKTMENRAAANAQAPTDIAAPSPSPAEEKGPQQGDTNAEGLVFRNGRWHRDGQEIVPSAIAQRARDNGENIWAAAKRELGVQSMMEIPSQLRKELGEAMSATAAGKAPEVKPPSPGRQRAMDAQKKKQDEAAAESIPESPKLTSEEKERLPESLKEVTPVFPSEIEKLKGIAAKSGEPASSPAEEKAESKPKSAIREAVSKAVSRKMEDFGEYIPGARKEGAKKLGPRAPKSESELAESKKPTWMKPFSVSQIVKSSNKSEEGKWSVTSEKQKDWMGQPKQLGMFDTKEEAEKAIPLLAVDQNHGVRKMPDGTFAIQRHLAKGKWPVVKGGFESEEAATKYMEAHPVEIIEHKFPKYESLQYLERVQRDGPDLRKGKDIRPEDFKKEFNLRGGQFGNWQSGKDGQISLNHAYDSFHDLADMLGLDKGAITLDGKLAMAFGARGTGGENAARAHYEPGERIINLTKMAGAGTLAHEWAHALDHMIAGSTQEKNGSSAVAMQSYSLKKYARPEVAEAVSDLYNTMMAHTAEEAIQAPKSKYSDKMEKEDQERREKAKENNLEMAFPRTIDDHLWNVKKNLERMARYKKKELKPEQVKEFDDLSAKIAAGDYGKGMLTEGKGFGGGRMTFENLEKLNELHRKMVGRGFHTNDDHSLGTNLYHKINSERAVAERVKQAEAGQTEKRKKKTSFLAEAMELDKHRVGDYYTQPEEMLARAFEAYISDKLDASGRRSDYLIGKGKTENERYRAAGIGAPFPEGEERVRINAAFDKLFDTLRGNELKASKSSDSSSSPAEKEKYSRSLYTITLNDVVHQSVDRYCRDQFSEIQVDQYAHPLVHAAVGGIAHLAVNHAFKGMVRTMMHAAVASAMAAWAANSMPQAAAQPVQSSLPPASAFQKQQIGNSIFNQIAARAMANHAQRANAAAAAPPSPNVQAAKSISVSAGTRAGVPRRQLTERPDMPAKSQEPHLPFVSNPSELTKHSSSAASSNGGSSGGQFNGDDHPRETTAHDGKRPGEFAPKGEGETGSKDGGSAEKWGVKEGGPIGSLTFPAESPRNYPDNLNKPASEQTLYSPPDRSIASQANNPSESRTSKKSPAAPNPRKAVKEGRSSVPLQPIAFHSKEDVKAQQKAEKELQKATSFNPDEFEPEKMADDFGEFSVPQPKEEDFQTPRHLAKMKHWRSQRPMSNGPGDEAAIAKWKSQKPETFETAMATWNRRKGAHQATISKRIGKNVVPEIAAEYELVPEDLQAAVDDEIKSMMPAHKRQEEARKYISEMGFNAGRLNRMEDSGVDHSSTSLDSVASEWAGLFPEIAGTDESQWVEKMWDLAKQGKQDPPSASDEDLVRRVAGRIIEQTAASAHFSAEEDGGNGSLQPVHGNIGDVDYTPFSRTNIGIAVDRYMRAHGIC